MNELSIEQFAEFFRQVHDKQDPFPWQERLARQVWTDRTWPKTLDLPTAAGKTAVLEIAVFLLALESTVPPAERKFPVRLVFVVDRRVIVDQAAERAAIIARQLHNPTDGLLAAVAAKLRLRTGPDDVPLAVATLRGGIQLDRTWARRPDQPTIIVSTVDQVGSRLLGRGYGVSDRMRPIHAGLLGNDTLFFLDEAHLSRPFAETLDDVQRYRRAPWPQASPNDRFTVVQMSATPGKMADFKLDPKEHAPKLALRFGAPKPARLVLVGVGAKDEEPARLKAMVQAAHAQVDLLLDDGVPRIIGVVVNRVATARAIFGALKARRDGGLVCLLLTGRSRPIDRDALIGKHLETLSAGREHPTARPLVVIATQCIEAGADFDFDALITECASLDALRQRFGRLDRLGDNQHASAVILARKDQVKAKSDDPVYGESLAKTWAWLNSIATGKPPTVDFGVDALANKLPAGATLEALLAPQRHAPVMLPAHLDAWAQTNPRPSADPEVALWLHGPQSGPPDVQIVWRADLTPYDLENGQISDDRVLARRPGSGEMLAMPIWAVERWLTGRSEGEVSDVEGGADPHALENQNHRGEERICLRWLDDGVRLARPREIEPGDVILVPASYGGADEFGWSPLERAPVLDLGDLVEWRQRGRAIVTLHVSAPGPGGDALLAGLQAGEEEARDENEVVRDYLAQLDPKDQRGPIVEKLLHDADSVQVVRFTDNGRLTMVQLVGGTTAGSIEARSSDFTTADDHSSLFTRNVSLAGHSRGVEYWARSFAERCGLPAALVEALSLAGWLHDVGKADPRFQCWLHDGDEVRQLRDTKVLAKSALNPRDHAARRRARERAGYPGGGRHELQSLALIKDHAGLRARVQDFDLVLHLVASHHGYCRPLPPAIPDLKPVEVALQHGNDQLEASSEPIWSQLDSGIPDRFWSLIERYGWFGLTWLEALLRLADHHRSDLENQHSEARLEEMMT